MRIILLLIFLVQNVISFSQTYDFKSYLGVYEEIEDYNSIALETLGDPFWTYRFNLDFNFPYFENFYSYLDCSSSGSCNVEGNQINFVPILLFSFGYSYDNVLNINDIKSDVRFKLLDKDNMKALVVQFTHCRLWTDDTIEQFDSHINFQWWFFENGTIQIRFGPRNLDNSNVYIPGEGFYRHNADGDSTLFGPFVYLYNPTNEQEWVSLDNTNDNMDYSFLNNDFGFIRTIPPNGWVFEFNNLLVSNSQIYSKDYSIYPNPTSSFTMVDVEGQIQSINIFTITGQKLVTSSNSEVDVRNLSRGVYIIQIKTDNGTITDRLIKY